MTVTRKVRWRLEGVYEITVDDDCTAEEVMAAFDDTASEIDVVAVSEMVHKLVVVGVDGGHVHKCTEHRFAGKKYCYGCTKTIDE